jgi:hypothetical protein
MEGLGSKEVKNALSAAFGSFEGALNCASITAKIPRRRRMVAKPEILASLSAKTYVA